MTYETIELDLSKDEAREIIADQVSGVQTRESDGTIEYRLRSGLTLAVLSDTTLSGGKQGVRLRYRTAMISTNLSHGKRKAGEIRRALIDYRA